MRGRPPKDLTLKQEMTRRLRTERARALYARRKVIVEPVFGQIKALASLGGARLKPLPGGWRASGGVAGELRSVAEAATFRAGRGAASTV